MWPLALAVSTLPPVDREGEATRRARPALTRMLKNAGIAPTSPRIYFRVFKQERQLEVWAAKSSTDSFQLLRTYSVAGLSGTLGPKRKEGDRQVPEGLYVVDRFNPASRFHLSLGLNYPNASDRILADAKAPGGDIFIHGSDKSIGCLAMTDLLIEEIYTLARWARSSGQRTIRVDIFPFRMTASARATISSQYPSHRVLWNDLALVYAAFQRTKRVPTFTVDADGRYRLKG